MAEGRDVAATLVLAALWLVAPGASAADDAVTPAGREAMLAEAMAPYAGAVTVRLVPCGIGIVRVGLGGTHRVDIRYGLEGADIASARRRPLANGAIEVVVPQARGRGRVLAEQARHVPGQGRWQREVDAVQAGAVADGVYGAELARNHFTIARQRRDGTVLLQLYPAYPMAFDLRPGRVDAVLESLERWQAETCTGS